MKTNLKPFDIEAAKAGAPVVTRDGCPVRIICYDKQGHLPIVGLITTGDADHPEVVSTYTNEGEARVGIRWAVADLVMAPVKRSGWVNLYDYFNGKATSGNVYGTESEARDYIDPKGDRYIATVPVEWEE